MAEIIGLCNQKGGVGKTTSAINLAASLAAAEKHVLLVDFDPQSNSSSGLGIQKNSIESNSYRLVVDQSPATPLAPQKTDLAYLDIIPAATDLVGAEVELVSFEQREYALKKSLEPYHSQYDFILIDSPPSLGLLTLNLLVASHYLLVPVQAEYYALEGISDLMRTVSLVQQNLNPSLDVLGILITMHDARNNLAHDVEHELRAHFGDKVFRTVIPRNIRLSEAPSHGKPVLLYDIKSKGAESYLQLAQEFLSRLEEKQQRLGSVA
ncbi:MAG: ParA family protein [Deltaproteobacteria bacterium]|nr:MAG: ParA family protein [Deltaproteobacteria bacterium]